MLRCDLNHKIAERQHDRLIVFYYGLTVERKLNRAAEQRIPRGARLPEKAEKCNADRIPEKAVAARATSLCWPAIRHARERAPRCSFVEAAP